MLHLSTSSHPHFRALRFNHTSVEALPAAGGEKGQGSGGGGKVGGIVGGNGWGVRKGEVWRPRRGEGVCELGRGDWQVEREGYPLYAAEDCPFISGTFNCLENGRTDFDYLHFAWRESDCVHSFTRFRADRFFEAFQNRRIVFVGDSTLLSSAIVPASSFDLCLLMLIPNHRNDSSLPPSSCRVSSISPHSYYIPSVPCVQMFQSLLSARSPWVPPSHPFTAYSQFFLSPSRSSDYTPSSHLSSSPRCPADVPVAALPSLSGSVPPTQSQPANRATQPHLPLPPPPFVLVSLPSILIPLLFLLLTFFPCRLQSPLP
ncbi:unnamed protein product [Closterium sp. NIES-54]